MYFCGEFSHTLDEKNRMVVPSKFRAFIESEEDKRGFFVLSSAVPGEKCLRVYTPSGWRRQVAVIRTEAEKSENPTEVYRLYASQAEFVPADTQSRMVLPQKLLDGIGLDRELLLVGNFEWIEIWDPREYSDNKGRLREKYSAHLARSLMPGNPTAPETGASGS